MRARAEVVPQHLAFTVELTHDVHIEAALLRVVAPPPASLGFDREVLDRARFTGPPLHHLLRVD